MIRYSATAAAMLLAAAGASAAGRSSPFDGKTFNAWKAERNAAWRVEKGELVGRQGCGGAASDLFSVLQWRDFELEGEWTVRGPRHAGAPAAQGLRVAQDRLRPSP
jgi:hypothetical protein